jgi:hypothetical protein
MLLKRRNFIGMVALTLFSPREESGINYVKDRDGYYSVIGQGDLSLDITITGSNKRVSEFLRTYK